MFLALQKGKVYFNTLGTISQNYYCLEDGTVGKERKVYEKITNENTIHWDAVHYYAIKTEGYSADKDYHCAFFPLFPFIWKLSMLSPANVIFLNFTLFTVGLLLLAYLFKKKWENILLILSFPMFVVYLIPYTEATFFFMFSLAVWGYWKDKYWLFFVAMILTSLCRNTLLVFLPAILCAEILFFIKERKIRQSLVRLSLGILPALIGTALVSIIQYSYGINAALKFLEVQKYWNHSFSLPNLMNLRDWSYESFVINVPSLIMIGIPLVSYLICIILKQFNIIKKDIAFLSFSSTNKSDYLNFVLMFCCLAVFSSILFFEHGNLHGLSRYLLCSPYFVLLLFINHEKLLSFSMVKRFVSFAILALCSLIILAYCRYHGGFSFHYLGYIIFVGVLALYLFKDTNRKLIYNLFMIGIFLLNILWTTYLFNIYLCNGWIYT
jgi:hypothetical protein